MTRDKTKYNIIIVEDNIGDFILLKDYLDDVMTNTHIIHFKLFKDFEDYFVSHINVTDIILLHLTLPDNSGEKLIKDVLKIANNTPFIVLTGFTDFPFANTSLSLGASDYLIKEALNPTVIYKSIIYSIARNETLTELKQSKDLYFNLFNKSPLPMFVFDTTSLKFLAVNETALKQYGYSQQEFLEMKLSDIRLQSEEIEDRTSKLDFIDELTGHPESVEFHKTKDNKIIVIETNDVSIIYEDIFAKLSAGQNITSTLQRQYQLNNRNERLKKIAWTQSHKVRAPLARILGIITALEDKSTQQEEKDFLMQTLAESGGELDEVITKIVKNTQFLSKAI
jgi:PAS domain S-box-containing protein